MSGHEYLNGVLSRQTLTQAEVDSLRSVREAIEKSLRKEFGSRPKIYYGGSYGKKSMIREAFDLDIVFYHPHDSATTVKEIRTALLQCFRRWNWPVIEKDVALRIQREGWQFHVDFVPGRAQDNTFHMATLYRSRTGTTIQTSVKAHIDAVASRRDLVRLMKLWSLRHNLHIKTFVLEQATMAGAEGTSLTDLGEQVWATLAWLRDNMEMARLLDPANTNNVVSDLATAAEKRAIAAKAKWCREQKNWKSIVW